MVLQLHVFKGNVCIDEFALGQIRLFLQCSIVGVQLLLFWFSLTALSDVLPDPQISLKCYEMQKQSLKLHISLKCLKKTVIGKVC